MSSLAAFDEELDHGDSSSLPVAVSPKMPHVLRNVAETPPTPGSIELGARCQYLADCFAQEAQIVASQTEMLQKLSKEQLAVKIGQIEDWALALGIDETRELDRCSRLNVLPKANNNK